jgi:ankyrin repeat protein
MPKVDVRTVDKDELTALHWAARARRDRTLEILLELKSDVSSEDENGMTALHWGTAREPQ